MYGIRDVRSSLGHRKTQEDRKEEDGTGSSSNMEGGRDSCLKQEMYYQKERIE
jgi:hypothetical protein